MLTGKTIILGVTGGIAAYKAANLASLLKKQHADVHVIMTKNAMEFITPLTFETLTVNKCLTDTFDRNFKFEVEHVELAKKAVEILDKKKGMDLKLIGIRDISVLADYFVIATGTSSTHVKALADEVEYQLGQAGVKPLRREGMDARNWILLDYGTVIVHVFYPETRDFYDLEHLWADATPVEIEF